MNWRAFLTDRTQVPGLTPLSLSWDAIGGPRQAVLGLENDATGFESMQSWLGSGVEIYDPSDRLAWWGFVDQVSQPLGLTGLEASLESVANRVAVRYRSMEPGKDFSAMMQTDWKDDPTSQAFFGVKEMLLQRDLMSPEQALQLRDISLSQTELPVTSLQVNRKEKQSQVLCRGWFERLRWRQWPAHSDVWGHSPSQQGYQSLGASLTQKSLAQSCAFPDALKLASMSVRIRKIGQPTDQVRFQIQSDAFGKPSGVIRAEATLAASAIPTDSYAWMTVWFAEPCAVLAGEQLWLVVSRDGAASSTAYFSLGLDESLGFPAGKLLLFNASQSQWVARTPDADLLFKVTALSDSVDLMAQIKEKSACFSGFSYEAGAGLVLPYVSSTGMDCYAAFMDLLNLGTPGLVRLLAEVNSNRRLRVYPQPGGKEPCYQLGQDGRIKDKVGKDLESPWQAVGNWLTSETGTPCFLNNLRMEPSHESYQIHTTNIAIR